MIARRDRGRLLVASVVFLFAANVANAQDSDESDFARTGIYVGAAAGVAIENAHAGVDDAWAINGWVGYRALPLFALELQLEHTTADNLKGNSGGLESITWTANSRLYFSKTRIQPFGLLGLGMSIAMEKESSKVGNDADVALRAGGGVEAHITPELSIVLSGNYLASFRSNRHLDYTSATVGVQYQF